MVALFLYIGKMKLLQQNNTEEGLQYVRKNQSIYAKKNGHPNTA